MLITRAALALALTAAAATTLQAQAPLDPTGLTWTRNETTGFAFRTRAYSNNAGQGLVYGGIIPNLGNTPRSEIGDVAANWAPATPGAFNFQITWNGEGTTPTFFSSSLSGQQTVGLPSGSGVQFFNAMRLRAGNGASVTFDNASIISGESVTGAANYWSLDWTQPFVVSGTMNVTGSGGAEYAAVNFEFGTAASVVPEPSTYALMATGLVGLGLALRRRK